MVEDFNVNWPNFGAGVAVGVAGTVAAYRAWQSIQKLTTNEGPQRVVEVRAPKHADPGYTKTLIEFAQTAHLLGTKLPLTDILIEPRFIRPNELASLPDEDDETQVFDVVPHIYDYPSLHAPYNIPTIAIDNLSRGDKVLALVGMPGSGRTTALLTIVLWSAGMVEFKAPADAVYEQMRAELDEAALSIEEQAKRIRQNIRIRHQYEGSSSQESVREALASAAVEIDTEQPDEAKASFRKAAPLYVHLANVQPTLSELGRQIDPAEPLLRGLQTEVGWLTSKRMVGNMYALLKSGKALVLIDGYDDLPIKEQPHIRAWLKAFIEMYSHNHIIISTPPEGYGLFMGMGATPVFLRPWNNQHMSDHVHQWIEHWPDISPQPLSITTSDDPQKSAEEIEAFISNVVKHSRGMNPHDFVLHAWAQLENRVEDTEVDHMRAYLLDLLPEADSIMTELVQMAVLQLDEGYITKDRLELLLLDGAFAATTNRHVEGHASINLDEAAETPAIGENDNAAVINEFFERVEAQSVVESAAATPVTADSAGSSASNLAGQRSTRELNRLFNELIKAGVLVPFRHDRYQFRHTYLAAYLAAVALVNADDALLIDKLSQPAWHRALCYLAQMRNIDLLVAQQLSMQPDVLHNHVLPITRWLRYAGQNVEWRSDLLRYMGNLFVAPHQYLLVRERIAAALVSSRDLGTLVIFRKALGNRNPDIRRIAALGLGALSDEAAVEPLIVRALQDPDGNVQIAAAIALSGIQTQDALIAMAEVLKETPEQDVRRAISESFAANRTLGYLTLYDALTDKDILIRRAAVFGIGRILTDWAFVALNEIHEREQEWYVRTAAEIVFNEFYEQSLKGVDGYPEAALAPWLLEWAEEQIELGHLPHDIEGIEVLEHAFEQQDDLVVRLLAMTTIGQVGFYHMLDRAYQALYDRQELMRDAAYRALGDFQEKLGLSLPFPV